MRLTAEDVVRLLMLQPHPEGGWYRETFRDVTGPDGRARSTAIYYLLGEGQRSHWHRVTDAVEVWCFHAGDPLDLDIARPEGGRAQRLVLGSDLGLGELPQAAVPAGWVAERHLPGRLEPGDLHRGAGLRVLPLRDGAGRLGARLIFCATALRAT